MNCTHIQSDLPVSCQPSYSSSAISIGDVFETGLSNGFCHKCQLNLFLVYSVLAARFSLKHSGTLRTYLVICVLLQFRFSQQTACELVPMFTDPNRDSVASSASTRDVGLIDAVCYTLKINFGSGSHKLISKVVINFLDSSDVLLPVHPNFWKMLFV
jgi:hypothetical protein